MASSSLAYFDHLRLSMALPTGVLRDLYGNVDMCVATTSIVPVNMTVYGTNATIRGLSSNFPYMFVSATHRPPHAGRWCCLRWCGCV